MCLAKTALVLGLVQALTSRTAIRLRRYGPCMGASDRPNEGLKWGGSFNFPDSQPMTVYLKQLAC